MRALLFDELIVTNIFFLIILFWVYVCVVLLKVKMISIFTMQRHSKAYYCFTSCTCLIVLLIWLILWVSVNQGCWFFFSSRRKSFLFPSPFFHFRRKALTVWSKLFKVSCCHITERAFYLMVLDAMTAGKSVCEKQCSTKESVLWLLAVYENLFIEVLDCAFNSTFAK